jgi:hypothetical protein
MEEIRYQRRKLKMNLDSLRTRQGNNHLLGNIVNDYEKYYQHMKEQDKQHEKKMEFIANYIEDIMETNQLTETGLNQLEYENRRILSKLDRIRKKMSVVL